VADNNSNRYEFSDCPYVFKFNGSDNADGMVTSIFAAGSYGTTNFNYNPYASDSRDLTIDGTKWTGNTVYSATRKLYVWFKCDNCAVGSY
jgi:hypothetical protein